MITMACKGLVPGIVWIGVRQRGEGVPMAGVCLSPACLKLHFDLRLVDDLLLCSHHLVGTILIGLHGNLQSKRLEDGF